MPKRKSKISKERSMLKKLTKVLYNLTEIELRNSFPVMQNIS
jgi:hypothetical protein